MAGAMVGPANGITGGYEGNNEGILRAMMAFTAIALYNAGELIFLVLFVFKKYSGLYFWSLIVTSAAIIPYQLGAWMKQVQLTSIIFLPVTLSTLGWMVMVTGQSLVLYSRLHLVTQNEKMLRAVLWLIIIDAIVLCIPTAVLTYGSQTSDMANYLPGYAVVEKIQMTLFSVQEFIISGIYLWEVRKILMVVCEGGTRNLMWQLVVINIIFIILDVALLSVEFRNYYQIETTIKGFIYSIKLKLEFGVLSKLVKIVTSNRLMSHDDNNLDLVGAKYADNIAISSLSSTLWNTGKTLSSKPSTANANGSAVQHLEDVSANSFETQDWPRSSDGPVSFPAAPDMPQPPKQRPSTRSSISEMYPGRLG